MTPVPPSRPLLLLGASGFLGGALRARLGPPAALHAPTRRDLDLLDLAALEHTVRTERPSRVVNCAGYGVRPGQEDPALADAINRQLPAWLARHAGCPVLHLGSVAELPGPEVPETASHAESHTLYGRTKHAGTRAVVEAGGTVARLFSVYGPGEPAHRLLPSLVRAAAQGTALELTDGAQRRDFTFVDDVVEALAALAERPLAGVVNVATGRLTTVRAFAEEAARQLRLPAAALRFGALPTRANELTHLPPPVERLRAHLGTVPSTTVAHGIRRSLA